MLTLLCKTDEQILFVIDSLFDSYYEDTWVEAPFVKEIIEDVDNAIIQSPQCIFSRSIQMQIPPRDLSTGTKALVLLASNSEFSSMIFASGVFGDNCCKWLLRLGELKDIRVYAGHILPFWKCSDTFNIYMKDIDSMATNIQEYTGGILDMMENDKLEDHLRW